jgi:hypothetical protein
LAFFGLLTVMFAEHGHGVMVDADCPGPAALGGSLDPLTAYHSG